MKSSIVASSWLSFICVSFLWSVHVGAVNKIKKHRPKPINNNLLDQKMSRISKLSYNDNKMKSLIRLRYTFLIKQLHYFFISEFYSFLRYNSSDLIFFSSFFSILPIHQHTSCQQKFSPQKPSKLDTKISNSVHQNLIPLIS